MLRRLHIKDVILIDEVTLEFDPGFNVLTGETGAGKSAIMAAIGQLLGERANSEIVRKGAKKAVVEASFDPPKDTSVLTGIDFEEGEELIIRREILASGRSSAFVNNQMVHLPLLKKLGASLVDRIGQRAALTLLSTDSQRDIVDLFGEIKTEAFVAAWQKEAAIKDKLEQLQNSESKRLRDLERYRAELQELGDAAVEPGEEEKLFNEYSAHVHSEELMEKLSTLLSSLSDMGPLGTLFQEAGTFEKIAEFDHSLEEPKKAFNSALVELQEVEFTLKRYLDTLSFDPNRLQIVNDRLSLINSLKRKYGPSFEEVQAYEKQLVEKLDLLENFDDRIEGLERELKAASAITEKEAKKLSEKRKATAKILEKKISDSLGSLNMSQSTFLIQVESQPRSVNGDDLVEFFFAPNVGEKTIAVRSCASGGELSRILLAIKVLLADKEQITTLLFDEIDANIGGETATLIGEKLLELGEKHQLLCITHFPQVARAASTHILIEKVEIENRTITKTRLLDDQGRFDEWSRMSGEKTLAKSCS